MAPSSCCRTPNGSRAFTADLADAYWDMYVERDRVEEVVGGFAG